MSSNCLNFLYNSEWGVAPPTIDICIHHGGRVVTTNVLYDYWGGDELIICNVSTDNITYTTIRRLVAEHLSQYNDVFAYYLRIPTVQIEEEVSLRKIEHEWYVDAWLSQIQVGHALDIYLAHRRYPTLIDPNRQRWLERRWERNGWISGHVEANRRSDRYCFFINAWRPNCSLKIPYPYQCG